MRRRGKLGMLAVLVGAVMVPAGLAFSRVPAARPSQPVAPAVQTAPDPDASQPTGTPPGIKVDAQDQEGPADQRDEDESEGESNNDDKTGDPGDAPGADHQCPPDCRSGEVG